MQGEPGEEAVSGAEALGNRGPAVGAGIAADDGLCSDCCSAMGGGADGPGRPVSHGGTSLAVHSIPGRCDHEQHAQIMPLQCGQYSMGLP